MIKKHFLLERPLQRSVEEVSHPLRTTVKPDTSSEIMRSFSCREGRNGASPACLLKGAGGKGRKPKSMHIVWRPTDSSRNKSAPRIPALNDVAPASNDRMHAKYHYEHVRKPCLDGRESR